MHTGIAGQPASQPESAPGRREVYCAGAVMDMRLTPQRRLRSVASHADSRRPDLVTRGRRRDADGVEGRALDTRREFL